MKRILLALLLSYDFKKENFRFWTLCNDFFELQNETHITLNKVSNFGPACAIYVSYQ